jgi:hypothetical protein
MLLDNTSTITSLYFIVPAQTMSYVGPNTANWNAYIMNKSQTQYLVNDNNLKRAGRAKNEVLLRAIGVLIILMIVVGLILGVLWPGKVTGAILPIAILMWWLLGVELSKYYDKK